MTNQEIVRLVNKYIGVSDGYLGDFSYRTHREFYPEFCDLDIDPQQYTGTTRERFTIVLKHASPDVQAKIIRGVLSKYPPDPDALETRTRELYDELSSVARRLEGSTVTAEVNAVSSATIVRAIRDAEALIRESGATSGVDRIHTLLHAYLRTVCNGSGIAFQRDTTMTVLLKLLRENHSAFDGGESRAHDITQVLRAMGAILDALNPIRNNASMAHPNDNLLDIPEAALVINAARTVLHYIDQKLMSVVS